MELLREGRCGSYLAYLPRGGGDLGERSRKFCYALKRGDEATISGVAAHLGRHRDHAGVSEIVSADAALVPMPGHAPRKPGTLWPAKRLAQALVDCGLGNSVLELLERVSRVRKSATAPPDQRPTAAQHLASFGVLPSPLDARPIVIVDDVITSGASMLAAISAISHSIPILPVTGFSIIRTESDGEIVSGPNPELSRIRLLLNGRTRREPLR